ncbi:MAG: cellulase family glycosylhydrolase, partial [Clostridiales bacterium]|nr:cellulase family glycosylhydrolase [Clostridiales bacterium]
MQKRMINRVLLLILCICFLSGCKPSVPKENQELTGQESIQLTQTAEGKLEEEEVITIKKISSAELVKDMRTGWNLGNTLDARSGANLRSEMGWGCPFTTPEMIQDVINAGFNVIRIPVTWDQHIIKEENYRIDSEWMARVKEVVDYA